MLLDLQSIILRCIKNTPIGGRLKSKNTCEGNLRLRYRIKNCSIIIFSRLLNCKYKKNTARWLVIWLSEYELQNSNLVLYGKLHICRAYVNYIAYLLEKIKKIHRRCLSNIKQLSVRITSEIRRVVECRMLRTRSLLSEKRRSANKDCKSRVVNYRGGSCQLEHNLALEEGGAKRERRGIGARAIVTNTYIVSCVLLSVCVLYKCIYRCACTVSGGGKETATHTGGGRGGYNIISRVGVV